MQSAQRGRQARRPWMGLTPTEPTNLRAGKAAAAGQHIDPRFAPIQHALRLREGAVQLPARRDDTFKRAAREDTSTRQGKLL